MEEFKARAKLLSDDFLQNEKQYRLNFVEAEQPNPKTAKLGETFVENTVKGVQTLLSVDEDLTGLFEKTIRSAGFDDFYADVLHTLQAGGKIVISGCGATGRVAIRIEASWKQAIRREAEKNKAVLAYENSVLSLMTGGDYAIIRSVESFEDYMSLGGMQAKEMDLAEKDLLIGVTATGETTSILGTAKQALSDGAKVWMVVCSNPQTLLGKFERADAVYTHPNCRSLYMQCGGMALTGSTRMQSSSIEQLIILSALELSLSRLVGETVCINDGKEYLINGFKQCLALLKSERVVHKIAEQIDEEATLYENGGHVTYFADDYLLDILADTTERSPTFNVPPFRPQSNREETLSWAFVKNPFMPTKEAWADCFARTPRCIDKTDEDYEKIGVKRDAIEKIPQINVQALYGFEIGYEEDSERENGNSVATWVGGGEEIPEAFQAQARKYKRTTDFLVFNPETPLSESKLRIFEHLSMKMGLNILSTGTMAKMGRVRGNYMVNMNIINKKLIDRGTRIISHLCGVDYDTANYELFYTQVLIDAQKENGSVIVRTIERLNGSN